MFMRGAVTASKESFIWTICRGRSSSLIDMKVIYGCCWCHSLARPNPVRGEIRSNHVSWPQPHALLTGTFAYYYVHPPPRRQVQPCRHCWPCPEPIVKSSLLNHSFPCPTFTCLEHHHAHKQQSTTSKRPPLARSLP